MFRQIPSEFICPLSVDQVPMQDPVIFNGTTYERKNITTFLASEGKDDVILVPNNKMKVRIKDWQQSQSAVSSASSNNAIQPHPPEVSPNEVPLPSYERAVSSGSSSADVSKYQSKEPGPQPADAALYALHIWRNKDDGFGLGAEHLWIRLVGNAASNGQDNLIQTLAAGYRPVEDARPPMAGNYDQVSVCAVLNDNYPMNLELYSVDITRDGIGLGKSSNFPVTMLVFDVTDGSSFDDLVAFLKTRKDSFNGAVFLVGNTSKENVNSPRVITENKARGILATNGLGAYIEASVKDGRSLDRLFATAVMAAKQYKEDHAASAEDTKLFKKFTAEFVKQKGLFTNKDVLKCKTFTEVIDYASANRGSLAAKIVDSIEKNTYIESPSIRVKMRR